MSGIIPLSESMSDVIPLYSGVCVVHMCFFPEQISLSFISKLVAHLMGSHRADGKLSQGAFRLCNSPHRCSVTDDNFLFM